jgi:hypothetical protein
MNRKRWAIRLAILVVAGIGFLLWTTRERPPEFLTVANRSGQRVSELQVTLGGETAAFRDVAMGSDVTVPLRVENGQRLTVAGRLADGTRLRVNGVIEEQVRLLVLLPGGEIKFQQPGRRS